MEFHLPDNILIEIWRVCHCFKIILVKITMQNEDGAASPQIAKNGVAKKRCLLKGT